MRWIRLLLFVSLVLSFITAVRPLIAQDISFHTDIARDFLLIEDIVVNKPITLIGPRAGGISGVFHGPLWLYLHVPAFLIGSGNPVVVGYFWILLSIGLCSTIYILTKRLFDSDAALYATAVFASAIAIGATNVINPYGALIFSPFFFYFFYRYLQTFTWRYLLAAFFILGLIIQCQMAFGLPILLLSMPLLIYRLKKTRKLSHLLTILILIFPLFTFVLFDIRHDFLQMRAVIDFISTPALKEKTEIIGYLWSRLRGTFIDGLNVFAVSNPILQSIVSAFFVWNVYRQKTAKGFSKSFLFVFFYFYIGFWILTLFFKGTVWSYYFWPFLPVVCMVYASFFNSKTNKILFVGITFLILGVNGCSQIKSLQNYKNGTYDGQWKFEHTLTKEVFADAPDSFGYFIFSPDQYGYSTKYAMNYVKKTYRNKKSEAFVKKETTYLIIAPPPSYRLDLNGDWWKEHQVNIASKPVAVKKYPGGFKVEKYILNKKEREVPIDSNLIQNLIFR